MARTCYMLDTNTVIDYLRGRGQVAARLLAVRPDVVGVSALVAYELHAGCERLPASSRQRSAVESFLSCVTVHPFGPDEARHAARVSARLATAGTPIGPLDTLLAGAALAQGAILVTRNTREYARVEGLVTECWLEP